MDFEKELLRGIPAAEAADFFIRIRGREKVATPAEFEAGMAELPAAEREELLKSATALHVAAPAPGKLKKAMGQMPASAAGATPMASPAALPPTARGQNMHQQPSPSLPPTAMGQQSTPGMKMAAKTPQEAGESRARANFAAGVEKERLSKGERWGKRLGTAGGALGGFSAGGALAHSVGVGGTPAAGVASLGGAALGALGGRVAGKAVGKSVDKARFKRLPASEAGPEEKAAAAFKLALLDAGLSSSLEQQEPQPQPGKPPAQGQQPGAPQGVTPEIDPATQAYLAAEMQANDAAEQSEAAYLREQLQAERATAQQSQQELATLSDAQANHDAQMAQIQAQVADSTSKSMAAQDQVLQQQQAAAAMRMAYQQLRGQLLEVASAEPPAMAGDQAAMAASQAAGASGAPAPTAGPAGGAPNPGVPPAGMAPEGDDTVSTPASTNEPTFGGAASTTKVEQQEPTGDQKSMNSAKEVLSHYLPFAVRGKTAMLRDFLQEGVRRVAPRLPHAAVGAAVGAGLGGAESLASNEPLRKKTQELEAKPDRGYGDTLDLAQSKARLTVGDFANKHPAAMMGMGALGGGMAGLTGGPELVSAAREAGGHLAGIGKNMKDIFTKGAA